MENLMNEMDYIMRFRRRNEQKNPNSKAHSQLKLSIVNLPLSNDER